MLWFSNRMAFNGLHIVYRVFSLNPTKPLSQHFRPATASDQPRSMLIWVLLIAVFFCSSCTIVFKAKDLELETEPVLSYELDQVKFCQEYKLDQVRKDGT